MWTNKLKKIQRGQSFRLPATSVKEWSISPQLYFNWLKRKFEPVIPLLLEIHLLLKAQHVDFPMPPMAKSPAPEWEIVFKALKKTLEQAIVPMVPSTAANAQNRFS